VAIFAGVRGYLDGIEIEQIGRFEQELLSEVRGAHSEILSDIRESGLLSDETDKKLTAMLDEFVKKFA